MLVLGLILLLVGVALMYLAPAEARGIGKVLAIVGGVLLLVVVILAVATTGSDLNLDLGNGRGD